MDETTIYDGQSLGSALRARRKQLGYRQADVAEITGFSERLISEIERGRDSVAYGKIMRYAGALGMLLSLKEMA